MRNLKKLAVSLVLAGSAATASAALITNTDGSFDFGGFDWASNGSAWITDYDVVSGGVGRAGETDAFVLNYQAFAGNVTDSTGDNLPLTGLNVDYEYTINAVINEIVTCVNDDCSVISIDIVSGMWDVFYDITPDATVGAAGHTGFLDGASLLSGSFTGGDTVIGPQGTNNPGDVTLAATFTGSVTSTNMTFINPALTGTEAVSTLQFGANTTSWTRPTNWDGVGVLPADSNTTFVGQADANQSFNVVPEPGSLALLGLGLGFAGFFRSRRNAK